MKSQPPTEGAPYNEELPPDSVVDDMSDRAFESWLALVRSTSRGRREAMAEATLHEGQTIGDFRLEAMIGSGGMGQVWRAEQLSLSRPVALKVLRPDRIDGTAIDFFHREARAGGRLSHPGIVSVHAAGEADGVSYIAQELVGDGHTLADILREARETGELPDDYFQKSAELVATVADAVQAAHDAGVIHRDLKPQNVLVTPDGYAKVTDFGLARILGELSLSNTGDFAGTYYYMSPEQVTARRIGIDSRTDVFSIGVMLYEVLTLQRPFQGDTPHQVAEKILYEEPPNPTSMRSRVPYDLSVVCLKALEKRREHRYTEMSELAADLRRFVRGEPVHARPPGAMRRARAWVRRHPAVTATLTVGLVALLIIGRFAVRESDRAEKLRELLLFEDLRAELDELWPPHPQHIDAYERWIADASSLLEGLPDYREQLPASTEVLAAERPVDGAIDDTWNVFWGDGITRVVAGLQEFADADVLGRGIAEGYGMSIPSRLEIARTIADRSLHSDEAREAWATAAEIAKNEYDGLVLEPQFGLFPIGVDPQSELLEFWHVASGARPEREDDGQLVIYEETGLVLVLIPGGTLMLGDQKLDVTEPRYDTFSRDKGLVREFTTGPFFLSKYELTFRQWERFTGKRPGFHDPLGESPSGDISPIAPVEHITAHEVVRVLHRMDLELPDESRWEYAARAGTQTRWPSGDTVEGIDGYANFGADAWEILEFATDQFPDTGPVNLLHPNDYGLYGIVGNVDEMCIGTDNEPSWDFTRRGGNYTNVHPTRMRTAYRTSLHPDELWPQVGVRPMRSLR